MIMIRVTISKSLAVAAEVGITEARGDLMPEDKVKAIRQLESEGASRW